MDKREQEFDAEIRRKLSEGSIDFDEAAWGKMEQKLAAGREKPRVLPMWLRAAAAVLLAGLVVWGYRSYIGNGNRERLAGKADGSEGSSPREERPLSEGKDPGNITAVPGVDDRENPATVSDDIAASEGVTGTAGQIVPAAPGDAGDNPGRGALPGLLEKETPSGVAGAVPAEEIIAARGLRRNRIGTEGVSMDERPVASARLEDRESAALPGGTLTAAGGIAAAESTAMAAESVRRTGKARPEKIAFSLSVLAAPDLNGVKGFDGGKVGFNAGLGFGVHFTDRLSLHTGLIYSKKPYDAAPGDYHSGYSPQGLVNIAANCDVIDIPLNLHYTVYHKGLNSISVKAGLSSYLMLREKYQYEYGNYDPRLYEYKNENQHFMGVGNAGLTLERRIGGNISIGLQPFIKVPLTGIGHGNVRLISAGAAVRLNLELGKKLNISDK